MCSLLAHGKVDKISDFAYRVWSQTEEGKHYIVIRKGLNGKPPAQKAKMGFDDANWLTLIKKASKQKYSK